MIDLKQKTVKRGELEAELDLYREAGIQGVADSDSLPNKDACVTEIERLQKENGYPVKVTPEFIAENSVLSKFLLENGAQEGDIVFAEDADLEEVAKIEAQIKADADAKRQAEEDAAKAEADKNAGAGDQNQAQVGLGTPVDLVYQNKTVVNVVNAIVHGKMVKDVYVVSGECFRMSPEVYDKEVSPRKI